MMTQRNLVNLLARRLGTVPLTSRKLSLTGSALGSAVDSYNGRRQDSSQASAVASRVLLEPAGVSLIAPARTSRSALRCLYHTALQPN